LFTQSKGNAIDQIFDYACLKQPEPMQGDKEMTYRLAREYIDKLSMAQ
jgi:hypothetical protein